MLKLLLKSMKVKDQKTKMKLEYVIAPPENLLFRKTARRSVFEKKNI